jgi:hypothetical protein
MPRDAEILQKWSAMVLLLERPEPDLLASPIAIRTSSTSVGFMRSGAHQLLPVSAVVFNPLLRIPGVMMAVTMSMTRSSLPPIEAKQT